MQLVNIVRSAQFNEDILRGSLLLIGDRLQENAALLDELASRFDSELSLLEFNQHDFNGYQRLRLQQKRPLIEVHDSTDSLQGYLLLENDQVLVVRVNNVTEQQAQATAYMLLENWQRSGESILEYLARVQPYFGFPLSVIALQDLRLSKTDEARMQYSEALVRISVEEQQAEALIRLPGTEQALRLGPVQRFNPYSWQVILGIVMMGVLFLGVGVYWVLNSFEVRLHKLERATSRLAQGHLSARVATAGNDPVGRLGLAFNRMAEHIQRLISIQREMVRAVSHELRTPVARIRFGLQIIEDSIDDPLVKKQLHGVDGDIQELDELIDEILTYARLEEGGPILEFQRVNVAAIAQQVVTETRLADHLEVIYAGEDPESALLAEVEPRYIHRAVQNLVGNAGRYARSQVRVVCSVGQNTCRIDVEDDGPGIPKEQWDKVFTAFARLDDSRTRHSGGYGLGLSIVRRIAYWHGGRASVSHSEQLGGACFSLVWPRRHPEE